MWQMWVAFTMGSGFRRCPQTTDFCPFGLAFEYNNLNKNKYLFSGKELQDGLVGSSMLEWYDFGDRVNSSDLWSEMPMTAD